MRRTEALGNVSNRYDPGNPALGVISTRVGTVEMNNIQEEISNAIEAEGIVLDQTGATEDQLNEAMNLKVQNGGTQYTATVNNNESSPVSLTDILIDPANFLAAELDFYLVRKTDSEKLIEQGKIRLSYDADASDWLTPNISSSFDDAGVVFSITSGGQVQYTSTSMSGANYEGTFKAIIRTIKL